MDLLHFLRSYVPPNKLKLFDEIIEYRTRHVAVVLEDLFQSHNASAVLRSCDCFGIQDVHVIENRNKWTTHRDIERGSTKWLTVHRYSGEQDNTTRCLDTLSQRGYALVATTPFGGQSLEDIPIDKPLALIFGTEKHGVSQTVINRSDYRCHIPMYGFTESFNISVAAAVCLYALRRRLEESKLPFALNTDEKNELLIEWCKRLLRNPDNFIEEFHRRSDL